MKPKHVKFFKPKDGMIFLPEAIIIATPRGGTSSLYHNMRRHPKFHPKNLLKEPCIFSWHWQGEPKALHAIRKFFAHPEGTFNVEGSPGDLGNPYMPERVWHINPNQKFIAMFRDPVKRAHENFWMVVKDRLETVKTFREAVELEESRIGGGLDTLKPGMDERSFMLYPYLDRGRYVKHLKGFLKFFSLDQFLIFKSEEFFADPITSLHKAYDFMEVPRYTPKEVEHWWDAMAIKGRDHGQWPTGELDPELAKELYDMFRPYNEELSDLLGRDFMWEYEEGK